MIKFVLVVGLVVGSVGFAADVTKVGKLTDAGIENFVAAFGALKPDHPVFEDQASGDVYRAKVLKPKADEKWLNSAKQVIHASNASAHRAKIESLTLRSATPSEKALAKAFDLITGRIKDNGTEVKLKRLLDDASLGKVSKRYVLYSGSYDTSNNSCEVAAVQDLKNSEFAVVTTCYNE